MTTTLLRTGPLQADFGTGGTRPTFGRRNSHPIAKFVDAVDAEFFFTLNMPGSFSEDDLTVAISWVALAATTGDVVWEVAFEDNIVGTTDLDSDSFAAAKTATSTTNAVSGVLNETTIAFAAGEYDGIAQGEQFRIRVRRLGTNVSDTMTDQAQVTTIALTQVATPIGGGGGGGGFFSDGAGTRAGIGKGVPAPTAAGGGALSHGDSAQADGYSSLALLRNSHAAGAGGVAVGQYSYSSAYSVALGYGSKVYGSYGVSVGYLNKVYDDYSVAIGFGSICNAPLYGNSIALGVGAKTYENLTTAIGELAQANNVRSNAFGKSAVTSGDDALAFGSYADARADRALAMCRGAYSEAIDGIAIGSYTRVDRTDSLRSVFIGRTIGGTTTRARDAIALGSYHTLNADYTIVIGKNHDAGSREVVIGGENFNQGLTTPHAGISNVVFMSGAGPKIGLYNDGNRAGNLAFVAGASSSCLHGGGAHTGAYLWARQDYNIFLATTSGLCYAYGHLERNIMALTDGAKIGNLGSGVAPSNALNNVFLMTDGIVGNYAANDLQGNVIIGEDHFGLSGFCRGNVSVGKGDNHYNYGYESVANIAIGSYNIFRNGGYGNAAIGYSNTITSDYTGPSDYHRGNVALGYGNLCRYYTNTNYLYNGFAHGAGAVASVHGQRAFSSETYNSVVPNAKPDQTGWVSRRLTTTDATQTNILSFPIVEDKAYSIFGWLTVRRTDANGENAVFSVSNRLAYRDVAGAAVLVGDPVSWTMDANQGAPPWTVDMAIVTNALRIRATGEALKTLHWVLELHVLEVRG